MTPDGNLFASIPRDTDKELFETLLDTTPLRLERIVSTGQSTPADEWYDQDRHEWVVLLSGRARLVFDDDSSLELSSGDFLNIPAHKRHRVDWTSPDEETVWLALHYAAE